MDFEKKKQEEKANKLLHSWEKEFEEGNFAVEDETAFPKEQWKEGVKRFMKKRQESVSVFVKLYLSTMVFLLITSLLIHATNFVPFLFVNGAVYLWYLKAVLFGDTPFLWLSKRIREKVSGTHRAK